MMEVIKELDFDLYELLPVGNLSGKPPQVIKRRRILIGRSQACDIVLNFREVTSIHAVLELSSRGKAKIFDMNSTNGTYVNGIKVVSEIVSLGDTISFGQYEFILKKYVKNETPPPLNMLNDVMLNGIHVELPPPMRSQSDPQIDTKKKNLEHATEGTLELPKTLPDINASDIFVPRVEYPLAKDPKAEFSEYIFEDIETLYPIFNYNVSYNAVEVIILFKDLIHAVDYIPVKNGMYYLVGRSPFGNHVEYAYFGNKDKIPFVEIRNGDVIVHPIRGHKTTLISDGIKELTKEAPHVLLGDEIIRFTRGDLQLFVRNSLPPPKVKAAPIFRRDSEFKKILLLMFLFTLAFTGTLALIRVDTEKENEKVPERIATILYKKELHVNKKTAVAKTEIAPKEIVQKSPVDKISEKKPEPKVTPPPAPKQETKPEPKPEIRTEVKAINTPTQKISPTISKNQTAPKKVEANKGPSNNITSAVRPNSQASKTTTAVGGGTVKVITAKPQTGAASQGAVETYKSNNWASTLNSALARGGISNAQTTVTAAATTSIGSGISISGGGTGATLETAKVTTNVGSLTGAARGKLDSSKGVSGLVDKKQIYTAGLPYKTVILGGMDPDVIRRILIENIPFFRQCYQKILDRDQQAYNGVVRLDFIIGASGRVTKAGVESASGSLPGEVKGCVADVLRGIQFPEPRGGGVVEVNQPFNFYPRRS